MVRLRRFLHGFFALAVLLGSLRVEPHGVALPAHPDCCCGHESQCPCEPVRLPEAPRGPFAPAASAAQPALPAAPRAQASTRQQGEPRPWEGRERVLAFHADHAVPAPSLLPRDLPRPPDRSLQKLVVLSQLRI